MRGRHEQAVWDYLVDVHQRREAHTRVRDVLRRHPFLTTKGAAQIAIAELEKEHGRRKR